MVTLSTPIEYIKGIGPVKADVLKKELNIFTAHDLITHYPFRYIDRTKFYNIKDVSADLPNIQLKGKFISIEIVGNKKSKRLSAIFSDGTGTIELVWFKGYQWLHTKFNTKSEYVIFGKPSLYGSKHNITHPEVNEFNDDYVKTLSAYQPVYNSTEKLKQKGLDSEGLRRIIKQYVGQIKEFDVPEFHSPDFINQHKLVSHFSALINIHIPSSEQALAAALLRLKFDELFFVQLKLLKGYKHRVNHTTGFVFKKVGPLFTELFEKYLPFELTVAQKRVLKEIRSDLGKGKQMSRLVQGDVGSGKTIVAALTMLLALDNGFQSCLMAPTEILAQQHFQTISKLFASINIEVALLTGSTKEKQKKNILEKLLSNDIKIIIGTHALIEDSVKFNCLGLAIIDEQHRFGVAQRSKLQTKNTTHPHVLVMTATPIPRTLAMTLYGDLDVSVIDELPPGRKPISTVHYFESHRLRLYGFLREQIEIGRQIYVVYPLIEESEKMDYQNLQQGYDNLLNEFPLPIFQISILHGRLTPLQKEYEMERFAKAQTQIMVATTVIEVGVNVPNASVMVIESAEKFGLSQLHQLRGRVGRGAEQSYCILMTGNKLSTDARLRMKTMVQTNDGFEISEADLKLRGPGDIQGTQQSGIMDLKLSDLAKDATILNKARNAAFDILDADPELALASNLEYAKIIASKNSVFNWNRVG
ncbi:MAG: ATP-dependent DNA helicase RecG [Bacteroidetes bacterium]|nr:ATP-dependent DNA helicase RecG [Bacteroidota bacterium]